MGSCRNWTKRTLMAVLAIAIWPLVGTHAENEYQDQFGSYRQAIVVVRYGMTFDAGSIQYPDLMQWLESRMQFSFARDMLRLPAGTGFYISTEGHVLTTAHVARPDDEDDLRDAMFNSLRFVSEDYGRLTLEIAPPGAEPIVADVVFTSEDADLAVIKARASAQLTGISDWRERRETCGGRCSRLHDPG